MSTALNINAGGMSSYLPVPGDPVVVVGTGPVGIRMLEDLQDLGLHKPIVIYGGEPWEPYNRVRLSSLLVGEIRHADIMLQPRIKPGSTVITHYNCSISYIDRVNNCVVDEYGNRQPYSKLVLATGSFPFIPNIPGIDQNGVYTFRDLNDTQELIARRSSCSRVVILGGGLLGLEAARAMQRFGTEVTVIEHNERLMFRQLDDAGSRLFLYKLTSMGMNVILGDSVDMIVGTSGVRSIILRSGLEIECDTLVVSTGIVPNIELAKSSGLAYGRGIKVNQTMQTSDPDIYAVGECCEYQDMVYGLVAPGFDQAAVAARNIVNVDSEYRGSVLATSLKVVGHPVFSMGDVDDSVHSYQKFTWSEGDCYRRLNVYRGRVIGVIAIGEWPELARLRELVKQGNHLWPWQIARFNKTGQIWKGDAIQDVHSWPDDSVICSCNGISKGKLCHEIEGGCTTSASLALKTGAGSVCGTCKPLLASLLGGAKLDPVRAWKPLLIASIIFFLVIAFALLLPGIPYNHSVQVPWRWDVVWTTSLYKQISGFTLLGTSVLVLILSLRKRIGFFKWGDFDLWRLAHVIVGGIALSALLIHTGFRLGENLNLMLMMSFILLLGTGAVIGSVIAMEHRLEPALVKQVRTSGFWLHLLLFWPVPVLLGFHVFKTYYF